MRTDSNRRDFLKQATAAASLAALSRAEAEPPDSPTKPVLLPTIKLGPHSVTRLIIGGNPVYGFSHFNTILSAQMSSCTTPARVQELLMGCEEAGINH